MSEQAHVKTSLLDSTSPVMASILRGMYQLFGYILVAVASVFILRVVFDLFRRRKHE